MNFFKPVKTGRSVPNIFIGSECSKSLALKVSASDPVKDGVLRCGDLGGVGHPVGQTHSLPSFRLAGGMPEMLWCKWSHSTLSNWKTKLASGRGQTSCPS